MWVRPIINGFFSKLAFLKFAEPSDDLDDLNFFNQKKKKKKGKKVFGDDIEEGIKVSGVFMRFLP